jgi:recombination DNA repair RAD52 pathway protein
MSFSAEQCRALAAKLDGRAIRERIKPGRTLSYIEGWYAIAEANRVFGFDGWDRETVSLRCVWEGPRQGRPICAYIAQVRIRVRAGETLICRTAMAAAWRADQRQARRMRPRSRRPRPMPPSGRW